MTVGAAVIGLGNVGMGYDYECVDDSKILTHTMAYHHHPAFKLVAGVDLDAGRRRAFEEKFAAPAFPSVEELNREGGFEVVSIAVPTEYHYDVFLEALAGGVKGAVIEKPMARTLRECREMKSRAESVECVLMVNFIRRYEPGAIKLRKAIASGEIGSIYKGIVWYSGGIANNGSHAVDLLISLLGEAGRMRLLSPGQAQGLDDRSPDLVIDFGGIPVYFLASGDSEPALMEIELMGTTGSVRYGDAGETITVRRTESDPLFPECVTLQRVGKTTHTDLARYQYHVIEALNCRLRGVSESQMNDGNVLDTAIVLDGIADMCKEAACE